MKATERVAKAAGVSARYIEYAKQITRDAPELVEPIKRGKLTIPEALRMMRRAKVEAPASAIVRSMNTEESSEKPKRGRPRMDPAMDAIIPEVLEQGVAQTERGAVEHILGCSAYARIVDARKADPAGTAWADYYIGPHGMRHKSILAALGRIDSEEQVLEAAKAIAEKRVHTRAAVDLIRRVRRAQMR